MGIKRWGAGRDFKAVIYRWWHEQFLQVDTDNIFYTSLKPPFRQDQDVTIEVVNGGAIVKMDCIDHTVECGS